MNPNNGTNTKHPARLIILEIVPAFNGTEEYPAETREYPIILDKERSAKLNIKSAKPAEDSKYPLEKRIPVISFENINENRTSNNKTFENATNDLFNNISADLLSPSENNLDMLGKNTVVKEANILRKASGILLATSKYAILMAGKYAPTIKILTRS